MKEILSALFIVITKPFRNFAKLNLVDKVSIILYLFVMMSIVGLALWWGIFIRSEQWSEVGTIFITGTIVSVIFSLLDKFGLLLPVESRIAKRLREIKDLLDANHALTKNELSAYHNQLNDTADALQGYAKYGEARNKFGFNAIIGLSVAKDGNHNVKVRSHQFAVDIFSDATPGSEICYMNSFITHDEAYYDEIRAAVARGADIRLLLMNPDEKCAAVKSRHLDYYSGVKKYRTMRMFVEALKTKYVQFSELESEVEESRIDNPSFGNFRIRYYNDSLNFPLITIRRSKSEAAMVAYTGYYSNQDSGDLPFIEWRGGDIRIVEQFQSLFESKWEMCSGNVYPLTSE